MKSSQFLAWATGEERASSEEFLVKGLYLAHFEPFEVIPGNPDVTLSVETDVVAGNGNGGSRIKYSRGSHTPACADAFAQPHVHTGDAGSPNPLRLAVPEGQDVVPFCLDELRVRMARDLWEWEIPFTHANLTTAVMRAQSQAGIVPAKPRAKAAA